MIGFKLNDFVLISIYWLIMIQTNRGKMCKCSVTFKTCVECVIGFKLNDFECFCSYISLLVDNDSNSLTHSNRCGTMWLFAAATRILHLSQSCVTSHQPPGLSTCSFPRSRFTLSDHLMWGLSGRCLPSGCLVVTRLTRGKMCKYMAQHFWCLFLQSQLLRSGIYDACL